MLGDHESFYPHSGGKRLRDHGDRPRNVRQSRFSPA
jgi:hypothetical protein